MSINRVLLFYLSFLFASSQLFAQSYNDGPISIDIKLREVRGNFAATDESLLGVGFAPDELTFKIWAQDNLGLYSWTGGTCLQDNNFTPTIGGANSIDFNSNFANFNFPSSVVPQYLDFRIDAWEDDLPSDALNLGPFGNLCGNGQACDWNDMECCGVQITWPLPLCVGIETGDDYRCDANPFYQGLDYRIGPPCQWYSHGYINGSGCVNPSSQPGAPNTNGYYEPHIETYWRYTRGTSFANSIDLGTLNLNVPLAHFNSNECYTNYYNSSAGNDVIYSFDITHPTAVNISLCGINGAQYDSYLYLLKDTNLVSVSQNDNYCANQSQIITSLCDTGTYYVVVDAVSPSDIGTFTLTVTEDPSFAFNMTDVVQDVSCNGGDDGQINVLVNGGYLPYSFSWFSANMTPLTNTSSTMSTIDSLQNLSASYYILHVTDNNNCIIIDTITVDEPSPLVLSTSSTPTTCHGYSDGQLDVIVSGGNPAYSYSWNTNPPQNNANAVFVSAGNYLLTVFDANNCVDTISETVLDPPLVPVSIISSTNTVCAGSSINLQATGALNYNWTPPIWINSTTSPNVIVTPNSSISYIVTGTDMNGCSNTDTISLIVIQSLLMTSNPSSPSVCEGESVAISVSGASSYSWMPQNGLNDPFAANVLASPQVTTNYMVIGTDNFGCVDTTYVNVDVLAKPTIGLTNNPSICEGESVILSANGADNYDWYPSTGLNGIIGSTVVANPSSSILYHVIGTSINGCSDTTSTVVSVNPNPTLIIFPLNTNICRGDTLSLHVNGAATYIWSPSAGLSASNIDTVQAFPISSTTYTVLGTDSLGCSSSSNLNVNIYDLPTINASSMKPEICLGESVILTATGAVQYSWNPSSSLSSNTGNVVAASPIINTDYIVTGTDSNTCSSWDTISIVVNPLPVLSINPINSTICNGESITLAVSGADSYIWSPSLGLNTSIASTVIASPDVTTNYLVTATDSNNCSDIIASTVFVNPSPTLTLDPSNASICEGSSIQIEAFGANSYTWSPSFGLSATNSNIVQASPNSSVIYTVVGIDANNCIDSIDINLIVGPSPVVTIEPDFPVICQGESILLTANGASSYNWYPSNNLSSSIGSSVIANPDQTESYSVIGTDMLNCTDTGNIVINVIPLPTASLVSGGGVICSGESAAIVVDVTGSPDWNLTYSIDGAVNQITSSTSPIIIYSGQAGTYTVPFILDANGCSNVGIGSEYVDVLNTPEAHFDFFPKNPNMLNPEISFTNHSIFADSYIWEFGDNTPNSINFEDTHIYQKDGTYKVALIARNGPCDDTAYLDIVINPYFTIYIPSVFTPNQDGLNDRFEPIGVGIDSYEIFIFNRWGDQVFKGDNILETWDGGECIAGTYSYLINIVDKNGEFHRETGYVLIE